MIPSPPDWMNNLDRERWKARHGENRVTVKGYGRLWFVNAQGQLQWRHTFTNGITNAGLDYLGNAGHCGGAQLSNWYAGVIDATTFSTFNVGDTMVAHPGWKELAGYSGNRPQWVNTEGTQTVSSNGVFTFSITANAIVGGMFICSNNTPGGTSGTLWCTAALPANAIVSVGGTLTGIYSYQLAGG